MVKVAVATNTDDLVVGVTAAIVVVVELADIVFDDDYIVFCVAVDVVLVAELSFLVLLLLMMLVFLLLFMLMHNI